MKKILLILLIGLISFYDISSQDSLPLPPEVTSFCGATRGYYFIAPTDFTVTSLRVPTTINAGPQSIALVRFNSGAPPSFPGTTLDYTTLHLTQGLNTTTPVNVSITISAGDVIGVYGSRNGCNSYGATGPFNTTLLGFPVTLTRSGMQTNIDPNYPFPIWTEAGLSVGRIEMTVSSNVIPTMGQWGIIALFLMLAIIGLVVIASFTIRRTAQSTH